MHPQSTTTRATRESLCRNCGTTFRVKGAAPGVYCGTHCRDIALIARTRPLVDRFWEKVRRTATCWLWTATPARNGYGMIGSGGHRGRQLYAHRISWEIHNGPIPDGMKVLHSCDVRLCVNPDHLFLGTDGDNVRDKVAKGRQLRGEHNPGVRLTEASVRAIRRAHSSGEGIPNLARQYGVDYATIWAVVTGKSWKHVQSILQDNEA